MFGWLSNKQYHVIWLEVLQQKDRIHIFVFSSGSSGWGEALVLHIGRVNKACTRCYPISRLWRIRCRVLLRVANRCVSSFNTPARHHRCRSKFRRTKQNTHINTHSNTHSFTAGKQRCERPSGLHYCTAAVVVYLFPNHTTAENKQLVLAALRGDEETRLESAVSLE